MHPFVAKLVKGSVWTVAALVVAAALYVVASYNYDYSNGERAGFVQKLSNRGWLCKTWEGELAMVNLPGQVSELFAFTVRDDAVAARINAAVGQRVVLTYEEHRGLPGSCFGETAYFVTDLRVVAPTPP